LKFQHTLSDALLFSTSLPGRVIHVSTKFKG
jgi:hypothetical protein